MAAPGSAQSRPIATPPDLVVSRQLRAPRELVWRVWTDPAHIVRWWGPNRFTCPHAEIDLRPGGALRFDMRAPDGTVFPAAGTVEEVIAPERLVITTRLAHEGGFDLSSRPNVRAWIARCEDALGLEPAKQ